MRLQPSSTASRKGHLAGAIVCPMDRNFAAIPGSVQSLYPLTLWTEKQEGRPTR
jgi:hypothetical protein